MKPLQVPGTPSISRLVDRWRFRALLGLLLTTMLLITMMPDHRGFEALVIVFLGAVFSGTLYATQSALRKRRIDVVSLGSLATLLWVIVSLIDVYSAVPWIGTVAVVAALVMVVLVVWSTFGALFVEARADTDALAGAILGYFLLALLWTQLYRALEIWQPGSFALSESGGVGVQMLYFSIVSITTLGYGDILPLSGPARILAGLEAAFGTLYIAILIGRIVGSFKPPRGDH